ncbi:hypothetical protein HanIR_Chr04g0151641 [Helianthus annuus]|nr:hypothetical protein HanIR_Chr04g0151641 [Helianthus annuus]KAJ0595162.1 putative nonaspanin (TM9SF) [Helianthus annuus]
MQEELPCQVVCRVKLDAKSAKSFRDMIDDEYRVNMYGLSLVYNINCILNVSFSINRSIWVMLHILHWGSYEGNMSIGLNGSNGSNSTQVVCLFLSP